MMNIARSRHMKWVDLRDSGTARHSRSVGIYARETAAALGLSPERVERIHAAGVLHDLGKLGIADAIIFKPGPLGPSEWQEIQRHPELGAAILEHAGLDGSQFDPGVVSAFLESLGEPERGAAELLSAA